jgi:hypothetical protein
VLLLENPARSSLQSFKVKAFLSPGFYERNFWSLVIFLRGLRGISEFNFIGVLLE